jgi:hypothetical protein
MLNHLILGQIATRPKGFWRVPERHGERTATHSAVLHRRETPASTTAAATPSDDGKR